MYTQTHLKILGIDPGYDRLGIAVVEKRINEKEKVVFSDCIETSKKLSHAERLSSIAKNLRKIIEEHKPNACSVETLFFSKNQKTALLVSEARGVILATASELNIEIFELSPQEIKIATTNHGRSDKKQVAEMVEKLVQINKKIKRDDEYDAIASALTCLARYQHLALLKISDKK